MEDHLRVAVCFWHTFCWPGSDVFGAGTFTRPWHAGANDAVAAEVGNSALTVIAGFEKSQAKVSVRSVDKSHFVFAEKP